MRNVTRSVMRRNSIIDARIERLRKLEGPMIWKKCKFHLFNLNNSLFFISEKIVQESSQERKIKAAREFYTIKSHF